LGVFNANGEERAVSFVSSDSPSAWTVVGKKTTPAARAVMGSAARWKVLAQIGNRISNSIQAVGEASKPLELMWRDNWRLKIVNRDQSRRPAKPSKLSRSVIM